MVIASCETKTFSIHPDIPREPRRGKRGRVQHQTPGGTPASRLFQGIFDEFIRFLSDLSFVLLLSWLVVEPNPLKNMSSSVGMMTFHKYGKNKNHVPNHQPVSVAIASRYFLNCHYQYVQYVCILTSNTCIDSHYYCGCHHSYGLLLFTIIIYYNYWYYYHYYYVCVSSS